MRRAAGLLLVGALACSSHPEVGSVAAGGGAPADVALIEEAGRQFSAAYVRGDAAAMACLYTEDGVIFPEGAAAITGRPQIERYWTRRPGRRITHHRLLPDEVDVQGDIAYDHGRFEVAGVTDGEAWGPSRGKYLVVWKRGDDGRWRMHLDMWNSGPRQGGS